MYDTGKSNVDDLNDENQNNSTPSNTQTNNSNSTCSSQNKPTSNQPATEKPKLKARDRAMNTFIGATLGLAVGGGILSLVGAGITIAAPTATILGASGMQITATGMLAFNLEAMVFGPFYFVELEPIEWCS